MATKHFGDIKVGATSVQLAVSLVNASTFAEMVGLQAANVTISYWRQGEDVVEVTVKSDLSLITSPWSSGGWKEASNSLQKGNYRFDVPNAAFVAGADWVVISVFATGSQVFSTQLNLEDTGSSDIAALIAAINTLIGSPAGGNLATALAAIKTDTGNLITRVTPQRAANLDNLDAAITTRLASGGSIASVGTVDALGTQAKADVKLQIANALLVDNTSEPSNVPAPDAPIADKIGWIHAFTRNKRIGNATQESVRNNADSDDIGVSSISDVSGTFTRGKFA